MKKEYNLKDKVWLHLGEPKLVEGRVVDIFDLVHLKEGHSPDRELYVIEIKTGIDDVYEVRSFDQLSPDAKGPIGLFRDLDLKQVRENSRYLRKVGMKMPVPMPDPLVELVKEINKDLDEPVTDNPTEFPEPTPEQIHAAMEKAQAAQEHVHPSTFTRTSTAKKRTYAKKRKPAKTN
jgi:hypothetical protein